ncbi:hypothetical protein [Dyella japonica]|uniref:Uncharacterized protein n=1 Tax=Dyella japonica TaxID=231455 RepID=A0ABV2K1D9_9GAMM
MALTLTVPAIWGSGPVPAGMPPELLAHYEVKPLGRTSDALIVSLSESRSTLTRTTRDASGKTLGTATKSSYDLYDRATAQYPGCPSAGYELRRFGRVLGPEALAASDQYRGHIPHLRKIKLHGSEVYIDLNVSGVQVYSDADFPEWQGWTFIDDDTDGNSRCDSARMLDLILAQLPPPRPGYPPTRSPIARRCRRRHAHATSNATAYCAPTWAATIGRCASGSSAAW